MQEDIPEIGIMFCGGGTAGHVFPALAVAQELRRRYHGGMGWIGSLSGMERTLVDRVGLPYFGIPTGKWRRYVSLANLTDLFKIAAGIAAAFVILARQRPRLLFSKGGYVSVPSVLAARVLGIPVWTHESDFDPGMATRIIAPHAKRIYTSFAETGDFLGPSAREKTVCVGNPVRAGFAGADPAKGRRFLGCDGERKLLLILGGSQGAREMNRLVGEFVQEITDRCFVAHQMGREDYRPSRREGYCTVPFFGEEMPHVLAAADVVITRAGANILAELALLGKAAILVPLSRAASRGDQLRNAAYFGKRGAAVVWDGQGDIRTAVMRLLDGDDERAALGAAVRRLARPRAAEEMAVQLAARLAGEAEACP